MIVPTPRGTEWRIERVAEKLSRRAELPGARVFDLAANALRRASDLGLADVDRLPLAFPSSWLVNSPAVSPVLRRWALPPHRETWLALIDSLRSGAWTRARHDVENLVSRLGGEPYLVEAISKVLALLVPDVVPLMPSPARAFVLAPADVDAGARAFVDMVAWFTQAAEDAHEPLSEAARSLESIVPLSPPQVLDRLLWFDSEGHRHFTLTPAR